VQRGGVVQLHHETGWRHHATVRPAGIRWQ
jgi:hypothetical protein